MGSLPNGTAILLLRAEEAILEAAKALLTCQARMARDAGISVSFYSSNLGPRCPKWLPIGDGGDRLGESVHYLKQLGGNVYNISVVEKVSIHQEENRYEN